MPRCRIAEGRRHNPHLIKLVIIATIAQQLTPNSAWSEIYMRKSSFFILIAFLIAVPCSHGRAVCTCPALSI
jgi:hypothetical protein